MTADQTLHTKAKDHGDVFDGSIPPRTFVGGMWDEIGTLQIEFMKSQGLEPGDVFVDVACGALRAGRFFIRYLDEGNYLGLEAEAGLVTHGTEHEVPAEILVAKQPEFVISRDFEFQKFSKKPTFGIANSLFTHLNPHDILLCLNNLRATVEPGMKFYASFFEVSGAIDNHSLSHAREMFYYTQAEMSEFGEESGFEARYIGGWDHPRRQMMMLYTAQ